MKKVLRYVLIVFVVFWICNQLFLIHLEKTFTTEEIDGWFAPITSKYGIKIVYEIGDEFFSPLENTPIPAGPARLSEVEPIRHRVLKTYTDILQKALEKYPVQVIRSYLYAIHFAGKITEDGFEYGGSYDPYGRVLYVVDNGWFKDNRPFYVIHHELSSLFLVRHSFFVNPWTDNNPKNYKYLYESTNDAMKTYNSSSSDGTDADYEKGFMNTYGQTNFENDFNEYSAMIFTYPKKFKEIMDKYPRVRGKFLIWLEFYQKIDPIFTEEYLLGND